MPQPIHTAPIDGTKIWLHVPGQEPVKAYFRPGVVMEYRDAWVLDEEGEGVIPLNPYLEWEPIERHLKVVGS